MAVWWHMDDMSPEFTVTFVTIVTNLGMPGLRPDIWCVQYLPQVHKNEPINLMAPSETSEVRD